jgi:hypothetical protein
MKGEEVYMAEYKPTSLEYFAAEIASCSRKGYYATGLIKNHLRGD